MATTIRDALRARNEKFTSRHEIIPCQLFIGGNEMLTPVFMLIVAAAPVELTVVQSVPAGTSDAPAKRGGSKHEAFVERSQKRTSSAAFIDAQGQLHLHCQSTQHDHAVERPK